MRRLRPSKPLQAAYRYVPTIPHPSWVHRDEETAARAKALTASEFWAGLGI
ncbi:MAG: hypothetical protein J7496_03400 [Novosphingobium sp.]|nr:hypothetical protein [Novosphingobium sp.]